MIFSSIGLGNLAIFSPISALKTKSEAGGWLVSLDLAVLDVEHRQHEPVSLCSASGPHVCSSLSLQPRDGHVPPCDQVCQEWRLTIVAVELELTDWIVTC